MVETLKDLVCNMTSSSSASKHDKVGITEAANSNNKMNKDKIINFVNCFITVSYTHLDVYKRQTHTHTHTHVYLLYCV